jgi:hypothetical protein
LRLAIGGWQLASLPEFEIHSIKVLVWINKNVKDKMVSIKSEIITARFAKIKTQGSLIFIIRLINFAIIAKPLRTLR